MKLISLNVWGGKILNPLLNFIDEEAKTTDIFCFQEVLDSSAPWNGGEQDAYHLFEILKKHLLEFNSYFSPSQKGFDGLRIDDERVSFGLAIFIRKNIKIESFDSIFIYREQNSMVGDDQKTSPRNAQFIIFLDRGGKKITIANVHGISDWPKIDTPARTKQSEIINEYLGRQKTEEIICGDFNLLSNTASVAILEMGRRNLIREFNIENTRTANALSKHVSDYVLVSRGIIVGSFSVSDAVVSDHSPLVLIISN